MHTAQDTFSSDVDHFLAPQHDDEQLILDNSDVLMDVFEDDNTTPNTPNTTTKNKNHSIVSFDSAYYGASNYTSEGEDEGEEVEEDDDEQQVPTTNTSTALNCNHTPLIQSLPFSASSSSLFYFTSSPFPSSSSSHTTFHTSSSSPTTLRSALRVRKQPEMKMITEENITPPSTPTTPTSPPSHPSTSTTHPATTATSLSVLDVITNQDILQEEMHAQFMNELECKYPGSTNFVDAHKAAHMPQPFTHQLSCIAEEDED